MITPFIDPAIPAILRPGLADYCASLRVDLPDHFTYYSCLPGLRAVFTIVRVYGNWEHTGGPRPWLDRLCERFTPEIGAELSKGRALETPEGYEPGDLGSSARLFLEFENGTVLEASTSEWGELRTYPGVRSCP